MIPSKYKDIIFCTGSKVEKGKNVILVLKFFLGKKFPNKPAAAAETQESFYQVSTHSPQPYEVGSVIFILR